MNFILKALLTITALSILLKNVLIFANPICNKPLVKNQTFQNLIKHKESELEKFSNRKETASKADETLSALIKANSKMIRNWINQRNLDPATQDELIVRRWRKYYAQNFILRKYPNEDQKVNQLIENLIEGLYNRFLPKNEKEKIQKIFEEAKLLSIQKIRSFPGDKKQTSQILEKVSKIKLYWMKDFKTSKFSKQPLEAFSWGVAYDPKTNEINMGLEALRYSNKETLFAAFVHEIGHSFDPCRWGVFFQGGYPFKKIVDCLRSDESVKAKKRDDSKMDEMVKNGKLAKDFAKVLKLNPTCNNSQYPPVGIQADQILESFADWFSAEVVSESKYITPNMRNDLCEVKGLNPGSSYPTNRIRLERIYLKHPKIEKKFNFKGKGKYCSLNRSLPKKILRLQ